MENMGEYMLAQIKDNTREDCSYIDCRTCHGINSCPGSIFLNEEFLNRMSTDEVPTEKGLLSFYRNKCNRLEYRLSFYQKQSRRRGRIIRQLKRKNKILKLEIEVQEMERNTE